MAELEADFVRTVLPIHGSKSEDSSLALPHTDKLTHADTHRRNRLQQQVQLTLSRKRKKPKLPDSSLSESLSNCYISRSISLTNIQLKRINPFVNHDAMPQTARPLWIGDRSQWPNSEPPRFHRGFGSFRYSTRPSFYSFTLPTATPTNNFHTLKHPLRYARSEVLRNPRLFVSGLATVMKLPIKPVYDANFADDTDDVFLPSTPHNAVPEGFEKNRMELEKRTVQVTLSKQREGAFGSHEQTENVSRQGHKRKLSLEVVAGRQPSQPGSLISMVEKSGSSGRIEKLEVKQHTMTASTKTSRQNEQGTEMTLKEAVNLLGEDNVEAQITAANFIQNQCFTRPDAKEKIHNLKGVPKLLELLQNDSEELQQAAASSLRNAVFENSENKMDVKDCEGLPVILSMLKKNRDIETRRQLTGLLWNLSSHDLLKEQLAREAVKSLTDNVLVPCSGISEGEDPKLDLLADPDVFYNATGCLRNLSSAGPDGRKALRDCEGLIECLIYYIRSTISDYKPNDKATENCVCILHNLSYRFDCGMSNMDAPEVQESKQSLTAQTSNPGCFIINTPKSIEEETEEEYPLLEENASPQGAEWLWSAITIRMYLSLIAVSANQHTKEASIGALQNLTACSGEVWQCIMSLYSC